MRAQSEPPRVTRACASAIRRPSARTCALPAASSGWSPWCRDARYARPAAPALWVVTAAVVLTLVIGIGANTAIFGLVDAALLKSLPVTRAAVAASSAVDQSRLAGSALRLPHRQHDGDPDEPDAGLVVLAPALPPRWPASRRPSPRSSDSPTATTVTITVRGRGGEQAGLQYVSGNYFDEPRRRASARAGRCRARRRPRRPRSRGRDQPSAVAADVRGPRRRRRPTAPRQRRGCDGGRCGAAARFFGHLHRRVGGRLHAAGREGDADARPGDTARGRGRRRTGGCGRSRGCGPASMPDAARQRHRRSSSSGSSSPRA